jgi:hypothetical protein
MEASDREQTPPEPVAQEVTRRGLDERLKGLAPISALYAEHVHKYIAYAVAFMSLLVCIGVLGWTFRTSKLQERFIALDGSQTFHIGYASLDQSPVYHTSALMAAQAHYQRSPVGLDLPELAQAMYSRKAYDSLNSEVRAQVEDLRVRNIHQKPEISEIRALREREGIRFLEVRGELLRSGSFQGMPIAEAEPFAILFALQRNPNLGQRGQYPYVVVNYQVAEIR